MFKKFLRGIGKSSADSKDKAASEGKARRGAKPPGPRKPRGKSKPSKTAANSSSKAASGSTPRQDKKRSGKGNKTGGSARRSEKSRWRPEKPGVIHADAILRTLEREPLTAAAIVSALRLHRRDFDEFDRMLAELERSGRIVRVRRDHFVRPETADLFTGKLQIHAGGSGHVLAEEQGARISSFLPSISEPR